MQIQQHQNLGLPTNAQHVVDKAVGMVVLTVCANQHVSLETQ